MLYAIFLHKNNHLDHMSPMLYLTLINYLVFYVLWNDLFTFYYHLKYSKVENIQILVE